MSEINMEWDDPENLETELDEQDEHEAIGSDAVQKMSLYLAGRLVADLDGFSTRDREQLYCWLVDMFQTKPEADLLILLSSRERKRLSVD